MYYRKTFADMLGSGKIPSRCSEPRRQAEHRCFGPLYSRIVAEGLAPGDGPPRLIGWHRQASLVVESSCNISAIGGLVA